MYVCVQLYQERLCRLLELNKLIIQINKSNNDIDRLQGIPNNIIYATADVALS